MNQEANISLYGDGTGEDFPVLKAFQQYIDAEQAKARRRLLTVSIIFVVMLLAVVAIFSALVIRANNQTQTLNDRLVEFAMKNPGRNYEDAKAAALNELNIKALNETVAKLQKQIEVQERKAAEAAENAARELAAAKSTAVTESDPQVKETEAKLQRALTLLKAEKQKLSDQKEKLRQEELERYRREHYPQYYAKKNAAVQAKIDLDEDLDEILDDDITYFDDEEPVVKPVKKSQPKSEVKSKPAKSPSKTKKKYTISDDDALEYFKDAESYTIPVEVKGKRAGWRVNLD